VAGGAPPTLQAQHPTGQPTSFAGQRTSRTLTGFAGGVERQFLLNPGGLQQNATVILSTVGDPASGVSIQASAERNTLSADFAFVSSAETLRIGFGEAAGGGSAFIGDRTFFAGAGAASVLRNGAARPADYALVTASELQHDGLLLPGVSFCVCEHLVWGFFGGERNIPAAGGVERWRSLELATWIAGAPVDATAVTQAMQATYQGHLIGSVARGPAAGVYSAVGGLSLTFDFSPGSYSLDSLRITNFDGMSIERSRAQGITGSFGPQQYSVTNLVGVHPQAGSVRVNLRGAFFGPGEPPANTGGGFTVQTASPNYRAAGIFAAARPGAP
jgi:hypothetical protein